MEHKIEELIQQMTLEEKVGMIHGAGLFRTEGVKRLSVPPLKMSDGPMGVRAEFANGEWIKTGTSDDYVTYLPSSSAIASSWNRELAGRAGSVLGEEARGRGKDVILAPGINIKRSPLCGRNFEYMSEDPCLTKELAVPMIEGIQQWDVAACVKHFAANSQETNRLQVDTIVDERSLQEIYFPAFKGAVQEAGTLSLMGAYNKLNAEHCCHSKKLLNRILREEWGFDGTVISDWGGVHDTKEAAESGLDIEMDVTDGFAQHYMADALIQKIKAGVISESCVDEKVRNILRMMFRLKMMGEEKVERVSGTYNTREHQDETLDIARESVILLKNEEHVLPLQTEEGSRIAVIGQNAAATHSNGGGSAEIKALYEISPLMGIKKFLGGNYQVDYAPGYDIYTKSEEQQNLLKEEALQLAKECDTVIFIGGLNHDYDVEDRDRSSMKLPYGQDTLIEELLKVKPDMAVVIYAGSPVEMPWRNHTKAILWSYYAGMEGGTALAEILFGEINPSARLAETFPARLEQCPAHAIGEFGREDTVNYKEGVMVGYRYYDTEEIPVAYCFGHGLSYTEFTYENLELNKEEEDDCLTVSVDVTNTGTRRGKEVVQIYVAPKLKEPKANRPVHELKGFVKLELKPGQKKRAEVKLTARDFAYYNADKHKFIVEHGIYQIQAGSSSRDIRLKKKIEITKNTVLTTI